MRSQAPLAVPTPIASPESSEYDFSSEAIANFTNRRRAALERWLDGNLAIGRHAVGGLRGHVRDVAALVRCRGHILLTDAERAVRAEQELLAERQRAEQLAVRLRALGIAPETGA